MKKAIIIFTLFFGIFNLQSSNFVVTKTADSGTGTLRDAISNANISPGSHTITFNIPISDSGYDGVKGVWVIHPLSTMPYITNSNIIIDGTTQTNNNPNGPDIVLDGNKTIDFGFFLYNASNITITGFTIHRFIYGIQITGTASQNNIIKGNYIGVSYNAMDTMGNSIGIEILGGPHHNTIGGSTTADRNIVSGNNHIGIRVAQGNYNIIKGNYVGLNRTGNAALRNYDGISIEGASQYNYIGGTTIGERNYVSGNVAYGIPIFGAGCNFNVISGNYIGTDITGEIGIPNTYGVLFDDGASYNVLGGSSVNNRNIISGNSGYGVFIYNMGTQKDTVKNNYIGTNPSGTIAVPNGNGIVVDGPTYLHTIDNNVISGNRQQGIAIHITGSDSNIVIRNKIGTDYTGTLPIPNLFDGIRIGEGPRYNIIGMAPDKGNIIAFNGGNGITILNDNDWYNCISANAIFGNQGLGIDLFPGGVTLNDAGDADTGPNQLMNFPVITSLIFTAATNSIILNGNIDHVLPLIGIKIEVFKSDHNSSGYGQGKEYLGFTYTDNLGNWTFNSAGIDAMDVITTTATDVTGNTSEFSMNRSVTNYGIDNLSEKDNNIDIYPNPTKQNINITYILKSNSKISFSIYTTTGIEIYKTKSIEAKQGTNNFKMFLDKYSPGIYYVTINSDSGIIGVERFVIIGR